MRNYLYVFVCLILVVCGCNQRYWYRSKIDIGNSKKYSVKIIVKNEAPAFLDQGYVEVMKKAATKELKKRGYFEIPIDSPQFLFTLTLNVDSFNAGIKQFKDMPAVPYKFKHQAKAIMFDMQMKHYKQGWTQWGGGDDIYYFGEYRDIGRSEGVVRYLIRNARW